MLDARQVANAVAHIGRLPAAGETMHLIAKGQYSLWHHVPATLKLIAPERLTYLAICTLGFSAQNLTDLLELFDTGQVEKIDFIFSVYFRSVEHDACDRLTAELTRRKQRVASLRQHCKILLMQTTDGRSFTIESSANLRSCRNVEQSTFTNDAALLLFHKTWLNELLSKGDST